MNKQIWKRILIGLAIYFAVGILWGIVNFYPQIIFSSPSFIQPFWSLLAVYTTSPIFAIIAILIMIGFLVASLIEKRIAKIVVVIPVLFFIGSLMPIPFIVASILESPGTPEWSNIAFNTKSIVQGLIFPTLLAFLCILALYKDKFWKNQEITTN
jgi:hypothetical protein